MSKNTTTIELKTCGGTATVKNWITVKEQYDIIDASAAVKVKGDMSLDFSTLGDSLGVARAMDQKTIETYVTEITGVEGDTIWDKFLALPEKDGESIQKFIKPDDEQSLDSGNPTP